MTNYEQQLKALIDLIGYQKIVEHLLGSKLDQVSAGIRISHDKDGNLSADDQTTINSL